MGDRWPLYVVKRRNVQSVVFVKLRLGKIVYLGRRKPETSE